MWTLKHLIEEYFPKVLFNVSPITLNGVIGKLITDIKDWNDVQLFICFSDNIFLILISRFLILMITSVIKKEVYDFIVFSSISNRAKHLDKVFFFEQVWPLFHC
jgi:hypothetical protein